MRRFAVADHTPTDETVLRQPTAPIGPQEIAGLRPTAAEVAFGRQFAIGAETLARLLDALEALTAENATNAEKATYWRGQHSALAQEGLKLTARLEISPDHPYDGIACRDETIHQQDRLIDELRAELTETRLQCLSHEGQAHAAYEAQQRAEAEAERLKGLCRTYDEELHGTFRTMAHAAGSLMWCERRLSPGYSAAVRGMVRELGFDPADFEKPGAMPTIADHRWYATHRAKVEADYLVDLQARCTNCRGGKLNHMTWPDIHVCPHCHRDCRPAANEADRGRCGCQRCLDERDERFGGFPARMSMMVLCPTCGNKRCPHATDHRHACTGSNEPGQPGSSYGPPAAANEGN